MNKASSLRERFSRPPRTGSVHAARRVVVLRLRFRKRGGSGSGGIEEEVHEPVRRSISREPADRGGERPRCAGDRPLEPAADLRSVQREDVDGPPTDQRLGTRLGSMGVKTVERLGLDRHQERQPGLGLGQPGQARRGRGNPGRWVLRRSGLDQEQPGGASLRDEREERAHDALAGGVAVTGTERHAEPGTQPRQFDLFGRLPEQPTACVCVVSLFRQ